MKLAGNNTLRKFLNELLTMRKQVTPLTAFLPFGATDHLVERFRNIRIFDNLLNDMTFSTHSISCF